MHLASTCPAAPAACTREAEGIEHVLVNGDEVVTGHDVHAARPGALLRSGQDTETVTAR